MLIKVADDSNGKGADNMPKNSRRIQNDKFKILVKNLLHLSLLQNNLLHFDKNKLHVHKMR